MQCNSQQSISSVILRQNIREKTRAKPPKVVRLLHDNVAVHTARITHDAICDYGFQQIHHPPYTPYIAPNDYYRFWSLKKNSRGRHFRYDGEVKAVVWVHFEDKPIEYFLKVLNCCWTVVKSALISGEILILSGLILFNHANIYTITNISICIAFSLKLGRNSKILERNHKMLSTFCSRSH